MTNLALPVVIVCDEARTTRALVSYAPTLLTCLVDLQTKSKNQLRQESWDREYIAMHGSSLTSRRVACLPYEAIAACIMSCTLAKASTSTTCKNHFMGEAPYTFRVVC